MISRMKNSAFENVLACQMLNTHQMPGTELHWERPVKQRTFSAQMNYNSLTRSHLEYFKCLINLVLSAAMQF